MKNLLFLATAIFVLAACSSSSNSDSEGEAVASGFVEYNNPPAEGFNIEGSDVLAMLLADKSMQAMGGRKAWDDTRFLSWNFFGRRNHLWDKSTGDVRIEDPSNNLKILMNINTKEGKVQRNGELVTDSLDYFLGRGYGWWVNDSYWLVMPYKLKDSGVTLKYLREDTTMKGNLSDVIGMSFEGVGITPQNLYEVWIDADTKLVSQWAYYSDSNAAEPGFTTPWADYQKYGNIMLSGNRGDYELTGIKVLEEVPAEMFTSFEIDMSL